MNKWIFLVILTTASLAAQAQEKFKKKEQNMNYYVQEINYGPDIRQRDWKAEVGNVRPGGGYLYFVGHKNTARAILFEPSLPGGGDVERVVSFNVDSYSPESIITLKFSVPIHNSDIHGFKIVLTPKSMEAFLKDKSIAKTKHIGFERKDIHTFKLATVGTSYRLWYNNTLIAEGKEAAPFKQNEGSIVFEAQKANARLLSCQESYISLRKDAPAWQRDKLLYEEKFGKDSFAENWIYQGEPENKPLVSDNAFVVKNITNLILNKCFDAPVAMDCTVRLLPTTGNDRWPAEESDIILLWQINTPGKGNIKKSDFSDSSGQIVQLNSYWMDFGGTNNVTTRLRKNPGRQLIRQFTDRPRLLQRGKTYKLTVAQNKNFVEFWVNGIPLIRQYDETALSSGCIGFRSYFSHLEVSECKVWSLKDADSRKK